MVLGSNRVTEGWCIVTSTSLPTYSLNVSIHRLHSFSLTHFIEVLHLADGRAVSYIQVEDGFSNPNASVNQLALDWICSVIEHATANLANQCNDSGDDSSSSSSNGTRGCLDVLELYCGNGNHTVAIAAFARYRLCTPSHLPSLTLPRTS